MAGVGFAGTTWAVPHRPLRGLLPRRNFHWTPGPGVAAMRAEVGVAGEGIAVGLSIGQWYRCGAEELAADDEVAGVEAGHSGQVVRAAP